MNGGWPYRFALLDPKLLFVDDAYQRPLSTFAKRIEEHYNPALVGTLIVSERQIRKVKRYAVVDGQTRLHGMRAHGEPVAPCLVYAQLTRQQEAQLFALLQTQRRGMATSLRFRASLAAGDPEATAIARLVREGGMKVAGDGDMAGIQSIAALEWLYRRDPALLAVVLRVITRAWPNEGPRPGSTVDDVRTRAEILKGIGRFWRNHDVSEDRLIARLARVSPTQLRTRANALREGSGSSGSFDRHVHDALVAIYGGRR